MHKSQSTNIRNHAQKSIHKYPQNPQSIHKNYRRAVNAQKSIHKYPQKSAVNPQQLPTRS